MYPMHKGTLKIKNLNKKILIDNSINIKIYNKIYQFKIFAKILFCKYLWSEIFNIQKGNISKKIKIIFFSRFKAEIIFDFLKKKILKMIFFILFGQVVF